MNLRMTDYPQAFVLYRRMLEELENKNYSTVDATLAIMSILQLLCHSDAEVKAFILEFIKDFEKDFEKITAAMKELVEKETPECCQN